MGQSLCLVSWKQQWISVVLPLSATMMQQKGSSEEQGEVRSSSMFFGGGGSFFLASCREVSVRSWKWDLDSEEKLYVSVVAFEVFVLVDNWPDVHV